MANFSYEIFSTVVDQGTFMQAAEVLNITPSAVSHSISQLERELGFPIFIRNRTGIELTTDGKRILPIIQSILNSENLLQQVAANIKGLNEGSIRLGGFSSVCINWLPPIIQKFKQDYPKIEVSLFQGTFKEVMSRVQMGTLDIGFSALPVSSGLQVIPLLQDQIFCVTPKYFVPKNKTYVTKSDIGNRRFILQKVDYDGDTKQALDRYNVTPNSLSYSIDDASILSMVESDLGWGILPKLALKKLSGDVNVYPFDVDFYRTICLVTNKIQANAPSTRMMMSYISQYLENTYGNEVISTIK